MAFNLIKTAGLDDTSRERITREAQSIGRLGSSPHIITIYYRGRPQAGVDCEAVWLAAGQVPVTVLYDEVTHIVFDLRDSS